MNSVLCRVSASLPPQSRASFLQVHFSPRRLQSMASPQLSSIKSSSITAEKSAFISWQLVHNQTKFASSGLEPGTKYSCVGNPFVAGWMQRGDSGLPFDAQRRDFHSLQCLGQRTGLHSKFVFIDILISFKKHSKRSAVLSAMLSQ